MKDLIENIARCRNVMAFTAQKMSGSEHEKVRAKAEQLAGAVDIMSNWIEEMAVEYVS